MNQCQGCQAGWPTKKHKPWPKGSKAITFHEVPGGYPGEMAVCTRDRYEKFMEFGRTTDKPRRVFRFKGGSDANSQ